MAFPHPAGNERTLSYWLATSPRTSYPRLAEDARADVCIVGAGIVGMTTAYLLARAGKSVVVLDRERAAMAETGRTTAQLQTVIDTPLADLTKRFGVEKTKLAWDSQLESIRTIEQIARDERISCDLERLDAFLYSPHKKDLKLLKNEARLAREIGYDAEIVDPDAVPFPAKAALRYPDQGKFHVRKYLLGVAKALDRMGVRVFEGTEVREIESGEPATVVTADGPKVVADWVVSAANVPFHTRFALQTKLVAFRTYVVAASVPRGLFSDALYWDTLDPYHYTRVEPYHGRDLVIHGGEDHRVGADVDTSTKHDALLDHLREVTTDLDVVHAWSGEVIETEDELPYIGVMPGGPSNELVATGDSGTGMTNGTIAAVMLSERILGRGTPWDELYDPARVTLQARPVVEYVKARAADVAHVVGRAVAPAEVSGVDEIERGRGAILRHGLKKLAVSRDARGRLHAVESACTHAGCTVAWNQLERSWDCPCHGSRFDPDGEILHGPAATPLAPVDVSLVRKKDS